MPEVFEESIEIRKYIDLNKQNFEDSLLLEAVNVKDKIKEIEKYGNINLINNAHKLIGFVINGKEKELEDFAEQEGIAWATHALTLSFKLEWIQAIRRTLWRYIQKYYEQMKNVSLEELFILEKQINNRIDKFLNVFFIIYSKYKDKLIKEQRELVENLSVPIIPITPSISILPLIGTIDSMRADILEEKVLMEIGNLRIQTLIIDLSGIADMESDVIHHLIKMIDGISLMGCNAIITGLRAEVVRKMIHLGMKFDKNTETLGTLQQALYQYIGKI
ncbi:STAS domain-containing protein [Lederbergia citrea]|uniref:STAS domain-containing protein n=1 Tax=Lederbergia citrea TaxID=2833581 RepID=A0A942UUG1_9BACI|nr:STAS domain-containing protein [Lederbergia citrea]MBS4178850.1 STAS domain-containing protein [Lederbergia citrea]MBS4224134.1 STAS domain-containing protein [Lederbergia citrea]